MTYEYYVIFHAPEYNGTIVLRATSREYAEAYITKNTKPGMVGKFMIEPYPVGG